MTMTNQSEPPGNASSSGASFETQSEMIRAEHNRVIWHSRRGMLELDLVLEKFARHCYPTLSEANQILYRKLLACEDQQLFDWFLKKHPVDNAGLLSIIEQVLAYQAQQK